MPDYLNPSFIDTHIIPWSTNIIFALATFFIGKWIAKWITKITGKVLQKSKLDQILIDFIDSILYALLLLVISIAALNKLGVNTTSLIALIGAAGLAIGLSLQSSLQNFAAGVMLIVFRPIKKGDFVEVAGTSGSVDKITLFSTTLKTGDNKQVIVPNGSIYGDTITNYSTHKTRRIDMVIGVSYDDDLKKVRKTLEDIINKHANILKDPSPKIAVSELADSCVNFIIRPWVKSSDYWTTKCELLETIKTEFDKKGISIPYPHLTIEQQK